MSPLDARNERDKALELTLDGLKDFQLATVKRIMELFSDPTHSQRILVADEVGLGKTIIAKGVIASLLKDWEEPRPMRVTYICSNLALATENRKKLAVFSGAEQSKLVKEPSFGRLAEVAIPPEPDRTQTQVLEVCSLTPATSFSLTQGAGNRGERLIIFSALLRHSELAGCQDGLSDLFRNQVIDANKWSADLMALQGRPMHAKILEDFHKKLTQPIENAKQGGQIWLDVIKKISSHGVDAYNDLEKSFLRKVRRLFVTCCAANLDADLFILDEFQRFKDLINDSQVNEQAPINDSQVNEQAPINDSQVNEQALIASQVFSKHRQSKVLLLSATPFKAMTTLSEDEQDEAHLVGLQQVLKFLNLGPLDSYETVRQALQHELFRLKHDHVKIEDLSEQARIGVENVLRPFIMRTERVQIAADVGSVLELSDELKCEEQFSELDVQTFIEHDKLGALLKSDQHYGIDSQLMEFFKSAAWPLAFSSGYQLQEILKKRYASQEAKNLNALFRRSNFLWLPKDRINTYQLNIAKDAPNAKVRELTRYLFGDGKFHGPEMLLWIPPSFPHYALDGPFLTQQALSKTLIFSAWAMVPRMLSGLLSYESERRVLGRSKADSSYFPSNKRQKKVKGESAVHGEKNRLIRLDAGDLANWVLLYPSKMFVDLPLDRSYKTLEDLVSVRTKYFETALKQLKVSGSGTRNRRHWYLLAPMLLDQQNHAGWVEQWLDGQLKAQHASGFNARVKEIKNKLNAEDNLLGEMPDDLASYLAWLSIGSPAVCAYRALNSAKADQANQHLQDASTIAFSFVSLFNSVSGTGVIKRFSKQNKISSGWKSIVHYCAQGGLQAVLDEYVYMLSTGGSFDKAVQTIADVLRTSPSSAKVWDVRKPKDDSTSLRCHYAVPFGTQKMSDESGQERVVNIRESFNSPFRPFVLTSTSIGQEGLDFHWYCGEVVHWNLPENPIDLEQREGRVNRFQSLIVRRRVVQTLAGQLNPEQGWKDLFDSAANIEKKSDLIPYWHFPQGTARFKRIVPILPLSRETYRYPLMLKILSLYRLAFGQPGQHELLEYLHGLNLSPGEILAFKHRMMVDLAPINYLKRKGH